MPPQIRSHKGAKEPLVCLTAYTAPMARLLDPCCDLLLVGDSLAMVVYGMDSTLPVDLDTMIRHGKAVASNAFRACVVLDMPFGTYQESPEQAFRNSARAIAETGCSAIKLEGGKEMAPTIEFLVSRGIPVLAHIGLMPQHVNAMGGYKAQGHDKDRGLSILEDAHSVTKAGAFAVVLEGIVESLAEKITRDIDIPAIGIGASNKCDGQILVSDDMLGLTGGPYPRFVRNYARLSETIKNAAEKYSEDVRSRNFPDESCVYNEKKK